jgi:predicted RNA binding protein YcfA (HicA-like mRNA interferase family)
MPVKFREVIKKIKADGWVLVRQEGSHQQYKHPTKPGRVTIAGKGNKDVPEATRRSIMKQAGLEP